MAWLDRFRTKSSSVLETIVSAVGPNKPVYMPRDFQALAREGYSQNVYVYRACLTIAQAASAIPWKLYRQGSKLKEIDNHPLLDFMRKPNPDEGGASFWKKVFLYLYLSGNSYIEAIGPLTRKGPPTELWTLRPDRMRVIPGSSGVLGYEYDVFGKKTQLDASAVLHWKMFNPLDDWYGISPIAVASRVIDQMNASNDWNTALLQNFARPPGALSAQTALSPKQRDQLREDIKRLYSGPRNAGRPAIFEGGMTWIDMGTTPADMDWLKGKIVDAREIAIGIGVAPELLGDSANKTYSNIQEARKALYSEAAIPMLHEMRDHLNNWLVPMFDDDMVLDIDTSGVEALQEDEATKRADARAAYAAGIMMLNEARKIYKLEEVDDGNIFFIPNTGTLVPEEEILPPDDDETDDQDMPPLLAYPGMPLLASDPNNQPSGSAPTADDGTSQGKHLAPGWMRKRHKSREAKALYWSSFEARRSQWYGEVAKHVEAQYKSMHTDVITLLHSSGDVHAFDQRVPALLNSSHADWQTLYKAIYLHVGTRFAASTFKSLKPRSYKSSADSEDDYEDPILDYLNNYVGDKIQDITDTVLNKIRNQLTQAVAGGESIPDIADRLDALFLDQIIPNRSTVIARTEVIAASNLGSRTGALATGLDLTHSWLATGGAKTRETHAEADGQSVPLDQPFSVGDSQLMFPGDNSLGASGGEVINCRCTETYDPV